MLKARLAKLRGELLAMNSSSGGGGGEGFAVARCGDGRVAMIGFPSAGKSSMLSELTETESLAANYEFTTLTCVPGNLYYKDTRIQLLDLPGIIEGAAYGRGRGREVIAVARSSDMILMVLDASKASVQKQREILERELETVGLRLNCQPPDVYYRLKKTGGVKFSSTVPLTKLGEDPANTVKRILSEYKIHNCELLMREDISSDQLVDVLLGNRKYLRCLYCYNKIDMVTVEELTSFATQPNSIVISVRMKLNLDRLLAKMWTYMGLIRAYTKRKGYAPDLNDPVVLSTQRHGITVGAACTQISREMREIFNFGLIWGTSTKHSPQRCGLQHVLHDEDVLQIVTKTVSQQRKSKDHGQRAQAAKDALAERRKKKPLKT
jgi:small GTP-binding protein